MQKLLANLALAVAGVGLSIGVLDANASQAATLTFDGLGLSNYNPIPQTYGDEANLDVSYRGLSGPGNNSQTSSDLYYWDSGYSNLTGVAWSGSSAPTAEIIFKPLNGYAVNLLGFDLGGYFQSNRTTQIKIFNFDYSQLLFDAASVAVSGQTGKNFSFSNLIRTDGIRLQFGPEAYNVGIDNIKYEVTSATSVPTPALLPGLIGLGLGVLRKRKAEQSSEASA